MFAAVTEGRAPARPDPAIATIVAFFLLGHRILEALHQLVDVEMFKRGALFFRQLFEGLRVREPVKQFLRERSDAFDAFKVLCENDIKRVEVAFALHEARACNVVEAFNPRIMQPELKALEQHSPFLERALKPRGAQFVEEVEEDHKWIDDPRTPRLTAAGAL